MTVDRKMPRPFDKGNHVALTPIMPIYHWKREVEDQPNPFNYRKVMGFFLPPWQRGLVWTLDQKVRFMESLWSGLSVGTFTFNRSENFASRFDNLLIDGQQRMNALQCYLQDEFPVYGYRYSEVTEVDRRFFEFSTHFHCYITKSDDEAYLRDYYNRMDFGGTPHKEGEQV